MILTPLLLLIQSAQMTPPMVTRAHSHNDYAQKRPLDEALDNGFNSVEVDVYPVNGKLLVGHNEKDLKPDRTIESMYLDKLSARAKKNHGSIYPNSEDVFWVLVDVKTDRLTSYNLFKKILDKYPILKPRGRKPRVRFVISGERAIEAIAADKGKYAGIDGRFSDLAKSYSSEVMPWISGAWGDSFQWSGQGEITAELKSKLEAAVQSVHAQHKIIRYWGTPDTEACWNLEFKADVDLINTDHIADLRKWLQSDR